VSRFGDAVDFRRLYPFVLEDAERDLQRG